MRGIIYNRSQREKHIRRKEQILRKHRLDNPPHKYNDSDIFGSIVFQEIKIHLLKECGYLIGL